MSGPPSSAPGRSPVDQGEVIDWLTTPDAYGPGTDPVERIDTHTSIVFLTGAHAYKLKRAVQYDYLDYSTPDRRRACCEDEVRLNRRTAPRLYHGVRTVCRRPDGGFGLDGDGDPVDYVVDMERFDAETQLDRLAERGELDRAVMPRLADAVAHLHELAEWRFDHGGFEELAGIIRGNGDGLQRHGASVLDPRACEHVIASSLADAARRKPCLDSRRARGFVRHCHGDLHLRNVCLVDGVPTLFDCIEFNATFACIDVMYDLAFLLMDLLHRGLAPHANAVLNRYLERTGDIAGLELLPVFLATRATVRAKTSATAIGLQPDAGDAARLGTEARRYLELAAALVDPAPPQMVAVGGPSGSGKTTLARQVASAVGPAPGAIVLRSDVERKRLLGVTPETRLGPAGYTAGITRDVYRSLVQHADAVLQAGHGVVIDATWMDPLARAALRDLARARDVTLVGLWLDAPLAVLADRLRRRVDDASDATPDVAARQLERIALPDAWHMLNAAGDAGDVGRAALEAIAHARPARATHPGGHTA